MGILDCGGKLLDLSGPCIMGILNITPDSFADGGKFLQLDAALQQAWLMVEEGAAIIDIGGESTRPGAVAVSVAEELQRVIPIIKILAKEIPIPLSIDTSKPEVMTAAVTAGAGFINDINALRNKGALAVARDAQVPICLMHMQGSPRTMQTHPSYQNVVEEVISFLERRIAACETIGIPKNRLVIDPGFGFGKSLNHNITLLREINIFKQLGVPILAGVSRKSMLGNLLNNCPVEQRVYGSIAAAVFAALNGVLLLRVHDVKPTVDALRVIQAIISDC